MMNNYDKLQLEMEAHRKTFTQLEQAQRENAALKKLLDRANERMDELKSGALSLQTEQQPEQSGLFEAVRDAVRYLDSNNMNLIHSGSILHRKLSAALSATPSPAMDAKEE